VGRRALPAYLPSLAAQALDVCIPKECAFSQALEACSNIFSNVFFNNNNNDNCYYIFFQFSSILNINTFNYNNDNNI
jgi:hypothetical protein